MAKLAGRVFRSLVLTVTLALVLLGGGAANAANGCLSASMDEAFLLPDGTVLYGGAEGFGGGGPSVPPTSTWMLDVDAETRDRVLGDFRLVREVIFLVRGDIRSRQTWDNHMI